MTTYWYTNFCFNNPEIGMLLLKVWVGLMPKGSNSNIRLNLFEYLLQFLPKNKCDLLRLDSQNIADIFFVN